MATINCFTCFGDQDPVRDGVSSALQSKIGELISLLWDFTLGGVINLFLVQRNAERLSEEMSRLEELRDDLMRRVMFEEAQPQMEIMNQVKGWMQRVQKLRSQVTEFQESFERQSIYITGLCLGYRAVYRLQQLQELKVQGNNFNNVVSSAVPDASTLTREIEELRSIRDDIMRRIETDEAVDLRMKRTNVVRIWFERVDAFLSTSEIGGSVIEKLKQVRELKSQGNNLDQGALVSMVLPDVVEEVPNIPSSSIVGGEETLSEIRGHLRDDGVGIIGIYGLGGIGKTTLLKQIHNEFLQTRARGTFDVVIWATVSKDMNILSIQRDIGERVGLSFSIGESGGSSHLAKQQAKLLFKALSKKRFLLLLDDVWEKLDLEKIGIPHPGNQNCKIVLTTRSIEVCIDMDADQKVKVKLLDEVQSWELFRRKLRADSILNDPSIQPLAKKVVARCGGLPLTLVTTGRAMANKRIPNEWNHAIKALDGSASKVRGMDKVLSTLKFSFDNLENDTMRSALLYCALFPEDYCISRMELIEYWIGEGFLDDDYYGCDHIDDAFDRGHVLVSSLQDACLLERGFWNKEQTVMLHDAVRDMVLWLTSGEKDEVQFLAVADKSLTQVPPIKRWENAKRISLMSNEELKAFPTWVPKCPNLSTLLLNHTNIGPSFPEGFFRFMHVLYVLDLSWTQIEEVPVDIGLLVELRYLNLSWTKVRSLPIELGYLIRLRQLMLEGTKVKMIPRDAILALTSLQVLNMWPCVYFFQTHNQHLDALELGDLEGLCQLQDLRIGLCSSCYLEKLVGSDTLVRCTRSLLLRTKKLSSPYGAGDTLLLMAIKRLQCLRELILKDDPRHPHFVGELKFTPHDLPCLEALELFGFGKEARVIVVIPVFASLCKLRIEACHGLKDLTWVGHLPCLEEFHLQSCKGIEDVLLPEAGLQEEGPFDNDHEDDNSSFPKLRVMRLWNLLALRSISRRPLLLPSLETLEVRRCPQLKRLPLGPCSAPKISPKMRTIQRKQ